eukprot:CCRYP_014835-RA/>CCRYP_014835-RA protein AED:0.20 eAED:0.20 QI:0/-1/0/1/-1/1/1/0/531
MPFNSQLPSMTLTSEVNASYASNVQCPSTEMAESCFPGVNCDGFPMDPFMSASATVVSNATNNVHPTSFPPVFVVAAPRPLSNASSLGAPNPTFSDERSNGFLTRVMPTGSAAAKLNDDTLPTHPVPEFLCHIMSMVQDPVLGDIIAWVVPTENEPEDNGGGIKGIGKIVVYNPQRFQDFVLGNYYRHSKFSSFQRQMNYFGFKKRIHSGKKRKMSPCSFVNEKLGHDPQSLLLLKRKVRASKIHFRDVDDFTQAQDKYPQAGHVTQYNDGAAVIGKLLCSEATSGHNISHESLTAYNRHPINPSFMTEAFFNHSFSSPIQSHPKITSVVTCPQPFIQKISNSVPNPKNEATFSRATVAAREAKHSLFQAYQKNKLELLQKEGHSESASGAKVPVPLANPTSFLACGQYGAYDCKKWFVAPPDQSMPVSVVAQTNDIMTSLPKSPMLWSPALAASPSIPLPKRAASKPRQSVKCAEAPIDLDEYSRLLSTLLPPSNELFDDGSLTSSLWDEEEFQDADDCSILSMELGLTG